MKVILAVSMFLVCIMSASIAGAGLGFSVDVYGGRTYVETYAPPVEVYAPPPVVEYYDPPQQVEVYRYYNATETDCYGDCYDRPGYRPHHRHKHHQENEDD